jgi:hypothetical protein
MCEQVHRAGERIQRQGVARALDRFHDGTDAVSRRGKIEHAHRIGSRAFDELLSPGGSIPHRCPLLCFPDLAARHVSFHPFAKRKVATSVIRETDDPFVVDVRSLLGLISPIATVRTSAQAPATKGTHAPSARITNDVGPSAGGEAEAACL